MDDQRGARRLQHLWRGREWEGKGVPDLGKVPSEFLPWRAQKLRRPPENAIGLAAGVAAASAGGPSPGMRPGAQVGTERRLHRGNPFARHIYTHSIHAPLHIRPPVTMTMTVTVTVMVTRLWWSCTGAGQSGAIPDDNNAMSRGWVDVCVVGRAVP